MGWLEGRKTHLQWSIKFTYKALAAQVAIVTITIAGIAYNGWWIKYGINLSNTSLVGFGFGLGVFGFNLFWTISSAMRFLSDIRDEKYELRCLNKLELKDEYQDEIKMYKESRAQYEALIRQYQGVLTGPEQNNPQKSANPDIQITGAST